MEQITSPSLVVQLKLECLLKKPTQDDIIKAKEFYIQLYFESYKEKLVLRFNVGQFIFCYCVQLCVLLGHCHYLISLSIFIYLYWEMILRSVGNLSCEPVILKLDPNQK